MTDRAHDYASKARHYLANATKLASESGGLSKAGEMVWGALVFAAKAAAARRGKKMKSEKVISWAKREGLISRDDAGAVAYARALHGHFYEVELERDEFENAKNSVEVVVDKILTEVGL